MGLTHCKTKHMATLDGTPSDPGWDLDDPGADPGPRLDGTSRDSDRRLGPSDKRLGLSDKRGLPKVIFLTRSGLHEIT